MGMFGIVAGAITTAVGIIKDDEELVKKGMKRTAFGTATLIVGDVCGFSDAAGEAFIDNDA
jgi:glutamate synthase domain-containing protein 3